MFSSPFSRNLSRSSDEERAAEQASWMVMPFSLISFDTPFPDLQVIVDHKLHVGSADCNDKENLNSSTL